MISFVIYFHPSRMNNLKQTLRFLTSREEKLFENGAEIILICQTSCDPQIFEKYPFLKLTNLNLPIYNKPKMCNTGVLLAKHEVITILDSDRILPKNHFYKIAKTIKPSEFISTCNLHNLIKGYTDEEINAGQFRATRTLKSKKWELRKKNLFAGNTTFYKEDYLSCGGMDESFVGYGFADNDMTYNVMHSGKTVIWTNEVELHLHHKREIFWNDVSYHPSLFCLLNELRFHTKWNLKWKPSNIVHAARQVIKHYS